MNSLLLRGHFTRYLRASLPQSHNILWTNQRTCMVKPRKNILIVNHLQMGNSKYFHQTLKSRSLTSLFFFDFCCNLWPLCSLVFHSLGYCVSWLLDFIKRSKASQTRQGILSNILSLQSHSGIKTTTLKSLHIPR